METTRVLIADQDPQSRAVLRLSLEKAGDEVAEADARRLTLELARSGYFHLILLDVSIDTETLAETCRAMRSASDFAIIVLSDVDSEMNAIEALTAGADDYLVKPFHMSELLARIRAVLRRLPQSTREDVHRVQLEDRIIDLKAHLVRTGSNEVIRLTPKQCRLLQHFISHPDEALTHRDLLREVWGSDRKTDVTFLRVFVNQLRKKIERDPGRPKYLLTEPLIGYRYRPAKKVDMLRPRRG